eukprot:12399655-Karenia_brevis.AAC.1
MMLVMMRKVRLRFRVAKTNGLKNVRALKKDEDVEVLFQEAGDLDWDLLLLTETWRPEAEE